MRTIVAVVCILLLAMQGRAEERKRNYEKKIPKADIEELVLSTSQGKIEITQSEEKEIVIYAEIRVNAKSAVKADEMLELIQIVETPTDRYLNIETQFGKDMGLTSFLSGISVKVNYKVNIPKGIKLRLITTDGNIYLGNFSGELNADLRNGDFKAAGLKGGEVYIKQEKGNFSVEEVAALTGEFKNCTLQIGSGDQLRLTTNSCDGQLHSIDKLNVRSSGGNLKIGDIEELTGSSSFTKYEVQDLANILDMDMKWGEMNIRNIQLMFSEIRLKGSFTKVGLSFPKEAGYHLELKRNKSLKLDLPANLQLEERPSGERNVTIGTKFVGDPKYAGKVNLEFSNGSLFIQ